MRRRATILVALALAATACSNLGLGEAECTPPDRSVSPATILTVQAVPTAKYTPCIDELRLGWDEVTWYAESGQAGIRIFRSFEPFLEVTVTESCDIGDAVRTESGYPDIERYEDIESLGAAIRITIVPAGEGPLLRARLHVDSLVGTELDDRPVIFTIDDRFDRSIRTRTNLALIEDDYVWIIDELDAEEGTIELRSNNPAVAGTGLTPNEALDLIEENLPDVYYVGNWYFTFEGGCITYTFNAHGTVAETVALDADDAFGFYPAAELRALAERDGYEIGPPED